MPIFPSPKAALEWAEEILTTIEGGRTNLPPPEKIEEGYSELGHHVTLGNRLDAIEIRHASRLACRGGWPCPYIREKCLFHWHVPDPCIEYPPMPYSQEQRVIDCDATFRGLLRSKNYLK